VFECRFAALCNRYHAVGVFHDRAILDPSLMPAPKLDIPEEMRDALNWDQATLAQMRSADHADIERRRPIHDRLDAYRGWLLTNPQFLDEVLQLRLRWEPLIMQLGAIPSYPVTISAGPRTCRPRNAVDVTAEFVGEWNTFFERWELQGLASWDLPVPVAPNLSGMANPPSVVRPQPQITIQIPAMMALPGNYPLESIIEDVRRSQLPAHLQGWDQVVQQKHPRNLRFQSFRNIFLLHFFRDTVLAGRYRDRFAGRIEAIDRAFGVFLGSFGDNRDGNLGEDTVKKLRGHMAVLRRTNSNPC
jgi:hypothetical protein